MSNDLRVNVSLKAQDALDSIKDMESAVLRRAIQPWWYGLAIALPAGVLTTLAGMEISRLYMAPVFLLMLITVVFYTRKAGVLAKPSPSRRVLIIVLITMISVLVPLILLVQELKETYGLIAPLSLGLTVFIIALIAFIFERRALLSKINTENII